MHGSGDGGWGDGACLESMVHTFTLLLHATVLRCTSHSNFLTLNGNSHFFRFGYDFKKKEHQHYTHSYTYLLSVVEIKKIKKLLKRYFYPARNAWRPVLLWYSHYYSSIKSERKCTFTIRQRMIHEFHLNLPYGFLYLYVPILTVSRYLYFWHKKIK